MHILYTYVFCCLQLWEGYAQPISPYVGFIQYNMYVVPSTEP